MRQLTSFLEAIRVRTTTKEYYQMKFQASLHRAEIPSLDEVLGVGSSEEIPFDTKTDSELDQLALKMLEQRKAMRNV